MKKFGAVFVILFLVFFVTRAITDGISVSYTITALIHSTLLTLLSYCGVLIYEEEKKDPLWK